MSPPCPYGVAYLGPEGTFTQEAAIRRFGGEASSVPCASIDQVFRAVEGRSADHGVVPVENSTEGSVGRTLDLLVATPLRICGEVELRIHQHLLRRGPNLAGLTRVYSHAQSFAQCNEWLNRNLPGIERLPVASNAEAARRAAGEAAAAAIAGAGAATIYDLTVVSRDIEDEPDNTTRFLVLGEQEMARSGRDKTSLVMSAPNRPGAMVALLRPLGRHGVSMTKLESRPSRKGLWDYVFFADIEGHAQDTRVAWALAEIRERAGFMKVLGSYPAAP